jgi:hypothetical protein
VTIHPKAKTALSRVFGKPGGRAVAASDRKLDPFPDWRRILAEDAGRWDAARAAAGGGPRVLVATSLGAPYIHLESVLAVALTLRGAQVHLLLCNEFLPACMNAQMSYFPDLEEFITQGPSQRHCNLCFTPSYETYQALDLPVHRYGDLVTQEERREAETVSSQTPYEEIRYYCLDGLAIGEHAAAGALRFYGRGTLDAEAQAPAVLRRYFNASLLTAYMTRRLLTAYSFTAACFHHGIYVPQGLIGEVARRHDVRVVNWNQAYRKQCFLFSHHDTYHRTMVTEPMAHWENMDWTPEREGEILDYLKSRWYGTRDWVRFVDKPQEDVAAIARELGVDFSRPCVGMLTNVMWDAQLHFRENAFPNMLEWVLQTIRYFAGRPELQLILRVHPGELRGLVPSRQPIIPEIQREFPTLPRNVFLIGPESPISTYAAMEQCSAVIIFGTKTGIELASMGVPVIVGGEAWIRNKGLTRDASSLGEYFQLLDQLPFAERLGADAVRRARMYAYHFFFRRMIPLPFMDSVEHRYALRHDRLRLEDLLPGRSAGLDVICDGILQGKEFIYPAEAQAGAASQ